MSQVQHPVLSKCDRGDHTKLKEGVGLIGKTNLDMYTLLIKI